MMVMEKSANTEKTPQELTQELAQLRQRNAELGQAGTANVFRAMAENSVDGAERSKSEKRPNGITPPDARLLGQKMT
jgi:hypothetical protein